MAIPTLSPEQLHAARSAATMARRARADFKSRLRTGELTLTEALELAGANNVLAHMRVYDLLRSLPRVGDKRAASIMERLDIAANRRVRGLGRHQLAGLKSEFR